MCSFLCSSSHVFKIIHFILFYKSIDLQWIEEKTTPLPQVVGGAVKQLVLADLRFDPGSLTPEPMLVLKVERWLLPLQPLPLHSKKEKGKIKGKWHISAKSHTSLRFVCHAKLIAQLTQPLFFIFSLLQIST